MIINMNLGEESYDIVVKRGVLSDVGSLINLDRKVLIVTDSGVPEKYSVAVDTLSKEYRLVGEYRLQKYAKFLMEYYFPIHNQQSLMDGELMYEYAVGNATKEEVELIGARADRLLKKYIPLVYLQFLWLQ